MKENDFIERACIFAGVKNEAQLCKKMGINQSNWKARKNRGTAESLLFEWAKKENFDLNYIYYGAEFSNYKIENNIIQRIEIWIDYMNAIKKGFKEWFYIEFEKRFPEYLEWKTKMEKNK